MKISSRFNIRQQIRSMSASAQGLSETLISKTNQSLSARSKVNYYLLEVKVENHETRHVIKL